MKQQLRDKQRHGIEEVVWKLDEEQREYLTRLGYASKPYLFRITTRKIADVSKSGSMLLKEIDSASKKSKRELYRPLTPFQEDLLQKHNVKYVPFKFKLTTKPIR